MKGLIGAIFLCFFLGGALGIVSNLTGCTAFVLKQIEQDVATSTVEPLKSFRADTKHANDFLARNRKDGDYENY